MSALTASTDGCGTWMEDEKIDKKRWCTSVAESSSKSERLQQNERMPVSGRPLSTPTLHGVGFDDDEVDGKPWNGWTDGPTEADGRGMIQPKQVSPERAASASGWGNQDEERRPDDRAIIVEGAFPNERTRTNWDDPNFSFGRPSSESSTGSPTGSLRSIDSGSKRRGGGGITHSRFGDLIRKFPTLTPLAAERLEPEDGIRQRRHMQQKNLFMLSDWRLEEEAISVRNVVGEDGGPSGPVTWLDVNPRWKEEADPLSFLDGIFSERAPRQKKDPSGAVNLAPRADREEDEDGPTQPAGAAGAAAQLKITGATESGPSVEVAFMEVPLVNRQNSEKMMSAT